jgi:hypothetical protein
MAYAGVDLHMSFCQAIVCTHEGPAKANKIGKLLCIKNQKFMYEASTHHLPRIDTALTSCSGTSDAHRG